MQAGEAVATTVIILAVVVIMWRRGEGWRRMAAAAFIAWLGAAVVIPAWEIVFALTLRGYMAQQPTVVPIAVVISDPPREATSGVRSSAHYSPTPRQLPPTRTPVAPRVDISAGTEIFVNNTTFSPPMRPGPRNEGLVEWLRKGDRLVVTDDYVVNEEEFDTPQVWWPVRNPKTGKRGYLMDLFVEKN